MICQFQTNANGRTLESDSIRRASVSVALNTKQVIEIGRLVGLKGSVGNRDYFVLMLKTL